MIVKQGWNDTDKEKSKYRAKARAQCHFVHHKPHVDWPGIEPVPPRCDIGD